MLEPDQDDYRYEQWSWSELTDDPLAVALSADDVAEALPARVFEAGRAYPLERFALTDKAARQLVQLAELQGKQPGEYSVCFDREDLDAAEKLGAVHRPKAGWGAIVVGQDVADQLASDQLAAALKAERAHQREVERGNGGHCQRRRRPRRARPTRRSRSPRSAAASAKPNRRRDGRRSRTATSSAPRW